MHLPRKLYEVTSGTIAGCYALRPCAESTAIIAGVYGRALKHYPSVRLHAINPLSTHLTDLLSAHDASEISDFVWFTKCNISRELRKLHNLPFSVFTKERAHIIPVASDQASQEARLRYVLKQGTKEDLVDSPRDWPGVTGVHALETGEPLVGYWFDRTAEHRHRRPRGSLENLESAKLYEVKLSPLPSWEGMSVEQQRERVTQIVDEITAAAETRRELTGKKTLGAEAVMAFSPHYIPPTVKRSPQPIALAATKRAFEALRNVIVEFCNRFWQASEASRQPGAKHIEFPPFSYPPGRPMTPGDATEALTFAPDFALNPDVEFV